MNIHEIFQWYYFGKCVVENRRANIIMAMQNADEYDYKLDFANKKLISIANYLDLEMRKEILELKR